MTCRHGLEIIRKLAAADPINEYREQRLWWTNAALAKTCENLSNPAEARKHWIRAHDTLQGMKTKGTCVSKQDQEYLQEIRRKLGD
jgi:hypothetical protein